MSEALNSRTLRDVEEDMGRLRAESEALMKRSFPKGCRVSWMHGEHWRYGIVRGSGFLAGEPQLRVQYEGGQKSITWVNALHAHVVGQTV